MSIFYTLRKQFSDTMPCILLLGETYDELPFANFPISSLNAYFEKESSATIVFLEEQTVFAVPYLAPTQENYIHKEKMRVKGNEVATLLKKSNFSKIQLYVDSVVDRESVIAFLEGLSLGSYRYKKKGNSEKYTRKISQIELIYKNATQNITQEELEELTTLCDAVCLARDLVNDPPNYKRNIAFGQKIQELGKEAGFETEIWDRERIKAEKMGGLLAVSQGSSQDPIFAKLIYSPQNAKNDTPIVLVGKGVTFDTGGSNLKTSMTDLTIMKSDMGGAAGIIGLLYALAKNQIPVYVIALLPITDNAIGSKALLPGDVITMRSGKTVEITNTDGEGRVIMADALDYAKELTPELVVDMATLTGNALRALGEEGGVFMTNTDPVLKGVFEKSTRETYERMIEFPLWEEYSNYLASEVADIKNIGGRFAGAIVAAKFLENFVEYDWIHIDIAAPAYLSKPSSYRGVNGTGAGLRLLYHFLIEHFA